MVFQGAHNGGWAGLGWGAELSVLSQARCGGGLGDGGLVEPGSAFFQVQAQAQQRAVGPADSRRHHASSRLAVPWSQGLWVDLRRSRSTAGRGQKSNKKFN